MCRGALLNAGNWFLRQAAKPEAEAQQDVRNVMGAVHNVMGALAAPALVPGQMMKPNPYPPGSEEAAFYDASKIAKAVEWAPEMSLNMMGGGVAGTGEKAAGAVVGSGPEEKLRHYRWTRRRGWRGRRSKVTRSMLITARGLRLSSIGLKLVVFTMTLVICCIRIASILIH